MANRIQLRRDTTANWNNIDPVLADGEMGYDIVTNEIRIGNGSDAWSELSGNTISGGGGGTSINNPSGAATVGSSGQTWEFSGVAGVLTLPYDNYLETSDANLKIGSQGNVTIRSNAATVGGTHTWTFNTDGNLTLPQGGTITEANVGLADALILTPANITYPGQQLRIYSTGAAVEGNHLHLTTGNLYATELYLGDDNYFVKLSNTGNVGIRATTQSLSSTALWTFDTTGNLTLPAGGQIQSPGGTGNVVIEANDGNNTRSWTFETNGNITFPDATTQGTAYQRVTGSWTVTTGSADYSFTVPLNGTYTMWVRGKCDNGIITWNATATVTNNNVPVLGQQFAWNYNGGGTPIELTDIPHQFVGTANTVISSNPSVSTPTNTFTFTINNTSGSSQTVYWGYVTQ